MSNLMIPTSTTLTATSIASTPSLPNIKEGDAQNPDQFFVFGFTDADLAGSQFVPQQFWRF